MSTGSRPRRSHVDEVTSNAVAATVEGAVGPGTAGDVDYETAVRLEGRRLYALALSILRDPDEAEDALQDTMERAWRSWSRLRDPSKRSSWLATICVRRCFVLRRRLRLVRRGDSVDAPGGPDVGVLSRQVDVDLVRALDALSNKQRAVIALHYMYGYTLDECAPVMGCGRGTVRTHLFRALTTLRGQLSHD